jgi:hypothetical protein
MGHTADQHIEHAEHAQHAAHNPFDRQVTVSIAVAAAILAAVSLESHRSHTDTLRFQNDALQVRNEALRIQMDASIMSTEKNDAWSFYQAKKIRHTVYLAFIDMAEVVEKQGGKEKAKEGEKGNVKDEKMEQVKQGEKGNVEAGGKGKSKEAKKGKAYWQSQVNKLNAELPTMQKTAEDLTEKTKELQEESRKVFAESSIPEHKSHEVHMRADRFDLGELALQLGVVLCSMAILTKSRYFWYSGITCSLIGFLIALSGVLGWFMESASGHH